MRSVSEIVDALGGLTAVAAALDLPLTTVSSWKSRDSVPVSYWSPLLAAARKRGVAITVDCFAQIAAARPSSRAARAKPLRRRSRRAA